MHRQSISRGRGNHMFHIGDRTVRRNIDPSPMRGGIRL